MEDNPFERDRAKTRRKIYLGLGAIAWIGVFYVVFGYLPARREAKVRERWSPVSSAWDHDEYLHHEALREAVVKGTVVPRPDLGACEAADDLKTWQASSDGTSFAYGNAYRSGSPAIPTERDVDDLERGMATWERELDVITPGFARSLRRQADPKPEDDVSDQVTHLYVWDFKARKIVCGATIDLAAMAGAGPAIELDAGPNIHLAARKAAETRLWRSGPPPASP